jgi:hypothetical protein
MELDRKSGISLAFYKNSVTLFSMNLKAELQYLHDKIAKVDVVKQNLHLLPALSLLIKNGQPHRGAQHGVETELGRCQEEARTNRYGKEIAAVCKDLDILYCANEFYYATMITHNAIGTPLADKVAKNQEVRIAKAKKVLDLL